MLRIALCQANLPVGDIRGNLRRLREWLDRARAERAQLVVFPELAVTGYPPEDLLLKPQFAERALSAVHELASDVRDTVALVGFPFLDDDLYNAAAVLADGRLHSVYRKRFLPNYGVFDEQRYFASGTDSVVLDLDGHRIGITVCEDLWYPGGPAQVSAIEGGAELIVNLSASPYHRSKGREREHMFATRAVDYRSFVAFCNAVGGQDELVFDGHSVIVDPGGRLVARGRQFEEDLVVHDLDMTAASRQRLRDPRWRQRLTPGEEDAIELVSLSTSGWTAGTAADATSEVTPTSARRNESSHRIDTPVMPDIMAPEAELFQALVLGTRDYFHKNGFSQAVLGLSGGIDSALALVVAAEALGADAVKAVSMPSRFTADINREDGEALALTLGVTLLEMPIADLMAGYDATLAPSFEGTAPNVAEENLQARIRGNLVMALSNKFGWLVLTTGNKSEMSVGYATLYGDMAGGFSILKDVLKTWVYRIARWCNRDQEVIPQRIIDKPPTAELRDNQLDTDSLPPYDTLDAILEAYVEHDRDLRGIEALGFDRAVVAQIVQLVDRAEYKRRQSPPGVRVSTRAFGKDRRLPITNQYRPD